MLLNLKIKNFALIDEIFFEPQKGLNILTGETGAGKSILLDALGMVLGERADSSFVKNDKKAIIEAQFEVKDLALEPLFKSLELDFYNPCILRREISSDGRSRAFINDSPVNLNTLGQVGIKLINIHSQHENLILNDLVYQLEILDILCENENLLLSYKQKYHQFISLKNELKTLKDELINHQNEAEYKTYLLNELAEINPQKEEQQELETESETLNHADELIELANYVDLQLASSEQNIINALVDAKHKIQQISKYRPNDVSLLKRITSVIEELKDIHAEIENIPNTINTNPERKIWVEERLQNLYQLQKKHKVQNNEELIAILESLNNDLLDTSKLENKILDIEKSIQNTEIEIKDLANKLSKKRVSKIAEISKNASELLTELGMPSAVLEFSLVAENQLGINGAEHVAILFSANKGVSPAPIKKVASGGELSRVMLVLKTMLAEKKKLPTLIFDEIDTGISGETARKIAQMFLKIGQQHQLITVTHLPQVAAIGQWHFQLYKQENGQTTISKIKLLNKAERVDEIAKMLYGDAPTEAALQNAKELIG